MMAISRYFLAPLIGLGQYDYGIMTYRYPMEFSNDLMGFTVIVGLYSFYQRLRIAQAQQLAAAELRTELAQAQLENLRLQLQPHFLFNTLNTISSVMYEDVRAADAMITQLGDLLRLTLQASRTHEIPLAEELGIARLYLDLMQKRFENKLQVSYAIDPSLNDTLVPQLVLQPLLENSLRHGMKSGNGPIELSVAAHRKILRLLRLESAVEIAGEADGGEAAVAAIRKQRPDLVFLDVQMPGMDGFGVIQSLNAAKIPLPRVISITAHDKFALRAFEVHAFDYLLKPVSEERFREALQRARAQHEQSADGFASRLDAMLDQLQREKTLPDRLLVQEDSRGIFVPVKEISWVEADRNYVLLHCGKKTHTLRSTLDALQNLLDPKVFVRINRGTLVRLDAIRELLPWFHGEYKVMLHDNTELRWSRRYVTQRPELLRLS